MIDGRLTGRRSAIDGATVFAVEPHAVQVCWPRLADGTHVVTVGPASAVVHGGGPRAVTVDGLAAGTTYDITVDGAVVAATTTLAPPPGAPRARVATLSDLHLGETAWGHLPRIRDARPDLPLPPSRCLAAALREITSWGPDLLVVKGDITAECRQEEFDEAARLLGGLPFALVVLAGNHDGGNHRGVDPVAALGAAGIGVVTDVTSVDLPGLRVVALPTVAPGHGPAAPLTAARLAEVTDAVAHAPGGALVCSHHHPRRSALLTHWPPGMSGRDSRRFLHRIRRAHPATLVTSGHTHRNRRWQRGPIVVTEVGSVKDYPGTWGAYVAYDGGIVQSVRRVEAPEAIEWTERGRRMLFGVWGRYAPGGRDERCFAHTWFPG